MSTLRPSSDTRMLKIQQYKHETRGFRTDLAALDLTFGIHSQNPVIFQSQTENLPLLTVFSPQLISVPSFCYRVIVVCVIVIARYTVSFEK